MNLGLKIEISTILLVIFHRLVLCDFSHHLRQCPEFNPQNELDIELISGLWFGTEMITHFEDKGVKNPVFDSCVIIQIDEIYEWNDYNYDYDVKSVSNSRRYDFDPKRYRFLKLAWNEQDRSAEYTLKFNVSRRGLWIGTEPPRGSDLRKHFAHSHFYGTVQVMKAVGSHLVLTFCDRAELFTIILTRSKNVFAVDDVESVHNLLQRRGLAVQSVRELCRKNSAIHLTIRTSIVFTFMMLLLLGN